MPKLIISCLVVSLFSYNVQSFSSICLKCECSLDPIHTFWQVSPVLVMCSGFENINFNNNLVLPLRASRAIMSDMKLKNVPDRTLLNSSFLHYLDISENRIVTIAEGSFALLPALKHLDLSNNRINRIYRDSFTNCLNLQILSLSRNELVLLPHRFDDNVPFLENLDVSYNPLGAYFESDAHFLHPATFGEASKLRSLNLNGIGLKIYEKTDTFSLQGARNMINLTMCYNVMEVMPKLPRFLRYIDISQTGLRNIDQDTFPYLQQLQKLIIQDALNLTEIRAHAFSSFPELKILKLDGCRKLEKFSEYAFGRDVLRSELQSLTMSGTYLSSLGSKLQPLFQNLTTLDLSGAPWYCNCSANWIIPLVNDTLHCAAPSSVSGFPLSTLDAGDLLCAPEGPYANTQTAVAVLLSFGSLLMSVIAIWLFCEGAKVSRRLFLQKSPGTPVVGSPYGRITVEPNNAEQIRV